MATKNLGQVAAIWLGTSAPENTSLIWFDTTPAIRKHKVYDEDLADWVVLDNDAISAITYSELQTLAQDPGLTLGSWYRITDPEYANTLALAITSTKIKYVDINNNLIIDDLAGSKTYVVNSSNLTIDDIAGTWDALQKKLNFPFARNLISGVDRKNELILAERTVNGTTEFVAYAFKTLVSGNVSNSLTWVDNGIFFNFVAAVNNIINVTDGVVGYNQYQIDIANINQALGDMAQAVASSIEANQQYTDGAIEELDVYARQIPTAPVVPANPETIALNDSLQTICGKIQYWLEKLATQSDGIKVNSSYEAGPSDIVPGVSDLTSWMENSEWENMRSVKFDQPIRAAGQFTQINYLISQGWSVIIKKGTYNINRSINISNLFSLGGTLIFEPGVVINVDPTGTNWNQALFEGGVSGDNNIKGRIIGNGCVINLTAGNAPQATGYCAFAYCANINGFKFKSDTTDRTWYLRYCYHVSDCSYADTPKSDSYGNHLRFDYCMWLSSCYGTRVTNSVFVSSCHFKNPNDSADIARDCSMMIFNWFQGNGVISHCYSDENNTAIAGTAAGGFNHVP